MRSIVSFFLAAAILLAACDNNKSKETTSPDGKEKQTTDPQGMQNLAEEMEKQKEELGKLEPMSLDQLSALIPESLMGAKRTNLIANASMGAGLVRGEYELNDSTGFSLNIYDCAGAAGAGIYKMQYMSLINLDENNDEEYTKTIDFNGGKAFEHCDKASNDCTISYFTGGRFMVTLEGDHVGADALKQAAKGLNIK